MERTHEEWLARRQALGSTVEEIEARGGKPVVLAQVAGVIERGPATSALLLALDTGDGRVLVEVPLLAFYPVPEATAGGAGRCVRCARVLTEGEACPCPVPGW